MSKKNTEKNPIGRPRKVACDQKSFKGLVDTPNYQDSSFEIVIAKPAIFKAYLATFKSKKCEEIKIHVEPEKLTFSSQIQEEKTMHSQTDKKKEEIKIEFYGKKCYSYFHTEDLLITIPSIDNLDDMIGNIRESAYTITLYVTTNIDNKLNYAIFQSKTGITYKSDVEVLIQSGSAIVKRKLNTENILLKMLNYPVVDIKQLLNGKKACKANKYVLKAHNNVLEMDMLEESTTLSAVTFVSTKKILIHQENPENLYVVRFPKKSIKPFLIHSKDTVNFWFTENILKVFTKTFNTELSLLIYIETKNIPTNKS